MVLALPTTRVAVMGPAGKEYVYKRRAAQGRATKRKARRRHRPAQPRRRPPTWLKAEEAKFNQRYERELMNPREALSLGSISEIVMPTDLRATLGKNLELPAASLPARSDAVRPAGVLLMSEHKPYNAYTNNPLIHRDRRLGLASSRWVRSFAADDMSVLIVCRGPIRKEAIDVFREMGMTQDRHPALGARQHRLPARARARAAQHGSRARAPRAGLHGRDARKSACSRVQQMVAICREHGYRYVFAGYGFMAEDADFVRAIEQAGLTLHRPLLVHAGSGRQEGRSQAHRARERRVGDARRQQRHRAHPAAQAQGPGGAREAREERGPRRARARRTTSCRSKKWPTRVLAASYAKGIDLYTSKSSARRCATRP